MQAVLRDPGDLADASGVAFLAAGELFADFGRDTVVMCSLDEE